METRSPRKSSTDRPGTKPLALTIRRAVFLVMMGIGIGFQLRNLQCIHQHEDVFQSSPEKFDQPAIRRGNENNKHIPVKEKSDQPAIRPKRHEEGNIDSESPPERQTTLVLTQAPTDPPLTASPTASPTAATIRPTQGVRPTPEMSSTNSTTTPPVRNKWAYAFLVAGVSSLNPLYRGFLYNVAVSAKRLQNQGSKADVVLLIQMSVVTNETRLTTEDVNLMESVNVKVRYLPKFAGEVNENFYTLMMEKFRILTMTEYSRVFYLDSDVMPVCNLDYLFRLSEPPDTWKPEYKPNILIAGPREPASGGSFLFKPNLDDYKKVQQIIRKAEEKALTLRWPHWDPVEGFGHRITPPDHWFGAQNRTSSTNWTFHGAHADQGLLYHYAKYVKQEVSIIAGSIIQHWGSRNGTAFLESHKKHTGALNKFSCRTKEDRKVLGKSAPVSDFSHFSGRGKPWTGNRTQLESDWRYLDWFSTLKEVEKKLNTKFTWQEGRKPPLGVAPYPKPMIEHIRDKKSHNWTQYATCDSNSGRCTRF